jgi:hypothetical protein
MSCSPRTVRRLMQLKIRLVQIFIKLRLAMILLSKSIRGLHLRFCIPLRFSRRFSPISLYSDLCWDSDLCMQDTLIASGTTTFFPFLRAFPLLLEVLIDEYIIKLFYPSSSSSSSSSASSSSSTSKIIIHALMANPHVHSESITHISVPRASIHRPVGALLRTPIEIQTDVIPIPHEVAPRTLSAWTAGTRNFHSINFHGLTVKNPRILQQLSISASSHTATTSVLDAAPMTSVPPPSDGFVLTGDITLFGLAHLPGILNCHADHVKI